MEKYYISKERLEELKAEVEDLKTTKRAEVAERLRQAKEYGDLSENSEYSEARDEQGRIENRIFEVEDIIKNASIIKKGTHSPVVVIGSVVTLKKGTASSQYQIVGSNEAKPEEGKISNESPIGRAFMGHKVGDSVTLQTPGGQATYQITKIE